MKLKKLFIGLFLILLSITLVACKETENDDPSQEGGNNQNQTVEYVLPQLSKSLELTFNNVNNTLKYSTTTSDIFSEIRKNGFDQLLNYLDKTYFFKDKFDALKEDDAYLSAPELSKYEELIISGLDYSEYNKSLYENGYASDKLDDAYKNQLVLAIAREQVLLDYIVSESTNEDSPFYVDEEFVEDFYNEYQRYADTFHNGCIVDFYNQENFNQYLKDNKLVYKEGKLCNYSGDDYNTPYDEYDSSLLTDLEFIQLVDLASQMGCEFFDNISFDELVDEKNETVAKALFKLNDGEYTAFALPTSSTSSISFIAISTSNDQSKEYSALTDEEKNNAKKAYIKKFLDAESYGELTYVNEFLGEYRLRKFELTFHDRDFAYQYGQNYYSGVNYLNVKNYDGNNNVIVSFKLDGAVKTVTADDFYDYVSDLDNATNYYLYVANALKYEILSTELSNDTKVTKESFKVFVPGDLTESEIYKKNLETVTKDIDTLKASYNNDANLYYYTKYGYEDATKAAKSLTLTQLEKVFLASEVGSLTLNDDVYTLVPSDNATSIINQAIVDLYDNYSNFTFYGIKITADLNYNYVYGDDHFHELQQAEKDFIGYIKEYIGDFDDEDSLKKAIEDFSNEYKLAKAYDGTDKYSDFVKEGYRVEYTTYTKAYNTELNPYLKDVFGLLDSTSFKVVNDDITAKVTNDELKGDGYIIDLNSDATAIYVIFALKKGSSVSSYKYEDSDSITGVNKVYVNDEAKVTLNQVALEYIESLLSSITSTDQEYHTASDYYKNNKSKYSNYNTVLNETYNSTYSNNAIIEAISTGFQE